MIISSQRPSQVVSAQETLKLSKPSPNLPLTTGENMEAPILGQNDNHALVQKVNEFLRMYRSNPNALKDLITTAKDLFSGDNLKKLVDYIAKNDLQAILKVLDKIIITKDSMTNPFFLKDYIESLGLTHEKTLRQALSDPSVLKDDKFTNNFKQLLLKISSALQNPQISSQVNDTETAQKIKPFLNFVDLAGKVIEHLQIVNCAAMEHDHLFVLQIPFQYPDGIQMQDIFIETDSDKNAPNAEKQYRIVLFLEMDALGEIACDVSIKNKQLSCTMKFEDQNTCNFLSLLLAELRDKLSAVGYDCKTLQCIVDRQITSWKRDFLMNHTLFSQSTINISI